MRMNSLKTRILLFIGTLIIVLMMTISMSILFKWRALILDNQQQSALSVARTFAASILDGLIFQENGLLPNEGYLENQIHTFLGKNPQVKWLVMYDRNANIVVRSSFSGAEPERQTHHRADRPPADQMVMNIYRSPSLGWILEIDLPLQIHSKSWGELRLGFDLVSTSKQLQHLFFYILGFTIVFVLSILALIYFFINRMTQSLGQLVEEMNRFDLEKMAPIRMQAGEDEIGVLVSNFSRMRERLHQSRNQLLDAQRQVYRAEKLASVGRLASGVAHEINNPLHGMKSCLFAIAEEPQNMPQLKQYLSLCNEALEHISVIVQKLLGFSRQHAKQAAAIDVHSEIDKVLSLLAYRLNKYQIIIERNFALNLPVINADPHLLQEVIMNLLLNSLDAMEEGGTIHITTATAGPGRIRLEIADTGSGIDSTDMDRIFDPFFTTKEEGKGTGLGLSVSLGIIESHGGTITCESKPYRGTTFRITLPVEGIL